ncbi:MAG TPA: 2-dehydro-3-deoxygalactonokinase [Blastocatellia bacterium]|nr:2-dehydro-3-deoxygalactonokinase [Blastocatellia bacterium]
MATRADNSCLICVDAGTTNTRVWLMRDDRIIARAAAMTGVRDTARDGSNERLRATLRELIAEVRQRGAEAAPDAVPSCVVAAGMITSPLGLAEVAHVEVPAGAGELAAGVRRFHFPGITDLPVLLVPGVRSGAPQSTVEAIGQSDVMRGEETLCAGLMASGRVQPPVTVLNSGSHWKAIYLDAEGRIAASITTLSGEMIHAVQTTTILASAVPQMRPAIIDPVWCEAGRREQRRSGLSRALFCVRLLQLQGHGTPEERFAFLAGAFIAADLDALRRQNALQAERRVFITGGGALAQAWGDALAEVSIPASVLTVDEVEAAFLGGLRQIVRRLS